MRVKWKSNKNFRPDIMLSKIDSLKIIGENNKISYKGFEYQDVKNAIVNMVDFPRHCEGLNRENIVSRAISKIAKDGPSNKEEVMEEINKIVASEHATKERKYHLLTSLSFGSHHPFKLLRPKDATIRFFLGDYPKKYSHRENLLKKHAHHEKTPKEYKKVIISVMEKSANGAASKAFRCLDLHRSIWCLHGNFSAELFGDQWKPINRIRLGSTHTIHNDRGNIAIDQFWYEPNFETAPLFTSKNIPMFSRKCKNFIKRLETVKYSETIKDSLVRYVRALDERDQNVALLKLWGALESLTAPNSSNYDAVTRRCSFLLKDHSYHKQILENIRDARNSNIHAGDQIDQAKANCYQLQSYFTRLVFFHLHHQDYFSTLDEANSFLDLPPNKKDLEKKKELIEKAIAFSS